MNFAKKEKRMSFKCVFLSAESDESVTFKSLIGERYESVTLSFFV